MSSSMNVKKAEEIAKEMTYREAVYNALRGRCVPFKKATRIKLKELLDLVERKSDKINKINYLLDLWNDPELVHLDDDVSTFIKNKLNDMGVSDDEIYR